MHIIGIVAALFIVAIIVFMFVSFAFIKFVMIVAAAVVYGGCFLIFHYIFGENNTGSAVISAAITGTIIFWYAFKSLNEEDLRPSIEILELQKIKEWAASIPDGKTVKITREYIARSRLMNFFSSKSPIKILAEVRNENLDVVASNGWRALEISTDFEMTLGDGDIIELRINRKKPDILDSATSWLRKKFS